MSTWMKFHQVWPWDCGEIVTDRWMDGGTNRQTKQVLYAFPSWNKY